MDKGTNRTPRARETVADMLARRHLASPLHSNRVIARGAKRAHGVVTGVRLCQLAGCGRTRLIVRWPNGRHTIPCTGGMKQLGEKLWKIE